MYKAIAWDHNLADEGTYTSLYGRQSKDRRKFTTHVVDGKEAVTHWKVERLGSCALVEIQLETGRTHQIRVHFSEFGDPIGIPPGRRRRIERIPRLRPWDGNSISKVTLPRPSWDLFIPEHEEMCLSPCPEDMKTVLEALRYIPPAPKTGL